MAGIVLNAAYQLALVFASLAGLLKWRSLNTGYRMLTMILLVTAATEISTYMLSKMGVNVQPVHHAYTVAHGTLFAGFMLAALGYFRWRYLAAAGLFWTCAGVLNLAAFQNIHTLNTNTILLETFTEVIWCLLVLYRLSTADKIFSDFQTAVWVSCSYLLFALSTFLYLGLVLQVRSSFPNLFQTVSVAHLILNLLFYSSLGLAIGRIRVKPLTR